MSTNIRLDKYEFAACCSNAYSFWIKKSKSSLNFGEEPAVDSNTTTINSLLEFRRVVTRYFVERSVGTRPSITALLDLKSWFHTVGEEPKDRPPICLTVTTLIRGGLGSSGITSYYKDSQYESIL